MTPDYCSFQSGPLSGSALEIKHHHCHCCVYVGGVVAYGSLFPSVTLYTNLFSLIDTRLFTVYTCSFTVSFNTFYISSYYVSLLNMLIRIVLSILS